MSKLLAQDPNYAVGDKLIIRGANLGGQNITNDNSAVRVQQVNTNGGILASTHEGTAVGGTGLRYPFVIISILRSQNIAQTQTITYSALATMQIDFATSMD